MKLKSIRKKERTTLGFRHWTIITVWQDQVPRTAKQMSRNVWRDLSIVDQQILSIPPSNLN